MQISLQTMVLSIQIFLGMGLRLRALRARVELRYWYTKYTYARKAYEGNTFRVGQNKDATTDEKKMHRKA